MSPILRAIARPVLPAISILIVVFFAACSDRIKTDIIAFKALDEGLTNSNTTIQNGSDMIYHSLQDKRLDPSTVEKADRWYPKAKLIQKLSFDLNNYIESLKSDLKKEAGLKTGEGVESFREADKNAVVRLFDKKGKGEELYEKLQKYKLDIFAVDSQITNTFNNTIFPATRSFDSAKNKQRDFFKTFFDDIPAVAALAMLSKFQNNIKIAENRILAFFHGKIGSRQRICNFYSPFVAQSSTYVRPGEMIEITAAIGSFASLKAEIIINGKKMPLSEDGASHYKFKALGKPGKHKMPVEINYTDQDGKNQSVSKNIEYTVAKEAEINN